MQRIRRTVLIVPGLVATLIAAAPALAAPNDGRHAELITGRADPGKQAPFMYPDVSADGNSVVWAASNAQSSSTQGGSTAAFVARRSADGWRSTDASLPGTAGAPDGLQFSEPMLIPPGAERIVVRAIGPHDPAASFSNPLLLHLFVTTPGATTGQSLLRSPFENALEPNVVPGQQTVSRIYFTTAGSGGPPAPDVVADDGTVLDFSVIARRDADGTLSAASRLPDGSVTDQQSAAEAAVYVQLFSEFDPFRDTDPRNPVAGVGRGGVSVDGRRLFFYAYEGAARQSQPTDANGGGLKPLFVRNGNDGTVAVSRSAVDGEPKPARLLGASPDGDVSYFVSNETLDGQQGGAIYRYQLSASPPLTRLTPQVVGASIDSLAIRTGFVSRDGSTVYFVTGADMGGGAQQGGRNAYVWRNGELRFIADLGSDGRLRRVSRGGGFAVFSASTALAGANTGGFTQLFRYAAAADDLRCASCRADGSANAGPSDITQRPGSLTNPPILARGVSDNGHVFFTAVDRLTAGDPTMGRDVYEFTGDELRMLSGGLGTSDLVDNSDDGDRVYLSTAEAMVPEDRDGGFGDVYVRRSGSDIDRPAAAPSPCAGSACQGAPSTQPSRPSAGSASPGANENAAPRRRVAAALLGSPSLRRSALRALAQGRTASVRIRVRGEGRIRVRGVARVGARRRVVASGSVTARRAASRTVVVSLRLNAVGRRELERRGRLTVRIEARFGSAGVRTATVTLRRAK